MSDPRRFSQDPESDLAHALLRTARSPAPRRARQRAVAAATSLFATTSLTAAVAGGAVVRAGTVTALKWVGIIGIASVGAVTTGVALRDRARSVAANRAEVTQAPGPVAPLPISLYAASPLAPSLSPQPVPPAPPVPVAAPAHVRSTARTPSIRDEVATLERARSMLTSGDAALTLSILDDYVFRFPRGSLSAEAAVLRIEALVEAGDSYPARRAAASFLAAYPGSPYTARIRSVVGSNP